MWETTVAQNRERLSPKQSDFGELLKFAENAYNSYIEFMREIATVYKTIEQPAAKQITKEVNKQKSPSIDHKRHSKKKIEHVLSVAEAKEIDDVMSDAERAYKAYMDAERQVAQAYLVVSSPRERERALARPPVNVNVRRGRARIYGLSIRLRSRARSREKRSFYTGTS